MPEHMPGKEGAVVREIEYGGSTKEELLAILVREGISLNKYANDLFSSALFETSPHRETATIIELSIRDLDFENGATFGEILEKMRIMDLKPCPLEIGPYLRLKHLDQKEEVELGKNKAPKGSITILSKPVKEDDDDFPKGFYIRRMDNRLWLRGYVCPMDYVWEADARMAFEL